MFGLLAKLRGLFSQHGVTPRWSKQKQQQCTLKLPAELVSLVMQHLPPESGIALALTCRAFFAQFFPDLDKVQLSDVETERLLLWLEQDTPELYYCFDCRCLHRWRRGVMRTWEGRVLHRVPSHCTLVPETGFMGEAVPDSLEEFTYSTARLIMNRHFYGPLHGLSTQQVAVTRRKGADSLHGVSKTHSWSAKIINDSLYLYGNMVFHSSGSKGGEKSLRVFLEDNGWHLVCSHLHVPDKHTPSAPVISELARDRESTAPFCQTESKRITTQGQPEDSDSAKKKNWIIEVDRWHKLGECRSPDDVEWCNLVSNYHEAVQVKREDVCPAGMIRKEWMEGEMDSAGQVIEGGFVPAEEVPLILLMANFDPLSLTRDYAS
ncbi:hypothetical protein B0T16DRAFT_512405 [Cercophora newfieldiana]|uniref:F-box domain-containing protein n=1 Tax=Cercophora newfieldiana TaxID=92897 RepID=A0AA40CLS8_9PEZI|nr:hypothetical protein B0T16DRAFT_512405 [Cercophora newfieldiana]